MRIPRPGRRWRFLITPRWLGWHLAVIASVAGMLLLGWWQFSRAAAGNALSWAYTFEWPLFAGFALLFWAKTIRDELHPPAPAGPAGDTADGTGLPASASRAVADGTGGGPDADEDGDEELAAYNAYLARLHQRVSGHLSRPSPG